MKKHDFCVSTVGDNAPRQPTRSSFTLENELAEKAPSFPEKSPKGLGRKDLDEFDG